MAERGDLDATLAGLERRLAELEGELANVEAPVALAETAPQAVAPETLVDARAQLADLVAELDAIEAERDRIAVAARALREGAGTPSGLVLDGPLTIDAGPFDGLAALTAFARALQRLPESDGVQIRAFGASRAVIDVALDGPVDLPAALTGSLGTPVTVTDVGRRQVVMAVGDG